MRHLNIEDHEKVSENSVTERNDETWENSEEHIEQFFSEKLGFKNILAKSVQGVKGAKSNENKKSQAIICNLLPLKME